MCHCLPPLLPFHPTPPPVMYFVQLLPHNLKVQCCHIKYASPCTLTILQYCNLPPTISFCNFSSSNIAISKGMTSFPMISACNISLSNVTISWFDVSPCNVFQQCVQVTLQFYIITFHTQYSLLNCLELLALVWGSIQAKIAQISLYHGHKIF